MAFHDTFHGMVSVSIRYRVASAERGVGERVPKVPSRRDSERFRDVAKTLQENRPPKKLFERDFLHAQSYSIEPYRSQHPECRCHDVRSWCATGTSTGIARGFGPSVSRRRGLWRCGRRVTHSSAQLFSAEMVRNRLVVLSGQGGVERPDAWWSRHQRGSPPTTGPRWRCSRGSDFPNGGGSA